MRLLYFSEQAFNSLYDHIETNNEYYKKDNCWLSEFFNQEIYLLESGIEYPDFDLIITEDKNEDDYQNTVIVYNNLGKILTPKQACNKYMWTYLSHDKFWEYTRNRWPVERSSSIKSRYFCGDSRVSLTLNSISRLWWYGRLSYDIENNTDPFHLTRLMMSNSDLCQNLIQHEYSMNKNIILGILDGIKEYIENGGEIDIDKERSLVKYINRYGAVASLDFFERGEMADLTLVFLKK